MGLLTLNNIFMKMIIAILSLKNLGCYGSVKVKNEIPNSYESQMKSNQEPDLKWGREIRDPLNDIISLNDTMALVLTHRGRIMVLNLNNGKRESSSWTPSGEKINSISLNRDKKWFAYVSKGNNQIGVYDFKLGRLIWKKEIKKLLNNPPVILNDSTFLIGTRFEFILFDSFNGEEEKRVHNRLGITKIFPRLNKNLFSITDNGELQCLDDNLMILWSKPVGGSVESKLMVKDSLVFIGPTKIDSLWVLESTNGNTYYQTYFKNGHEYILNDDARLITISRSGNLQCVNLRDHTFWTMNFGYGLVNQKSIINNDKILIPFATGFIIQIDSRTGKQIWRSNDMKKLIGTWEAGNGFIIQDISFKINFYQ